MKKYIAEFIGTFFLVFTIGMAVIPPGAGDLAPLAIGVALITMVFSCGHLSGAHFNPAVTLGVWMRGKCQTCEVPGYLIAQISAAVVAALITQFLKPGLGEFVAGLHAVETVPALIAEFLFTFALVWVILNVATAKGTSGNSFYGLAIGGTVMAGAFAVGSVSGGVFNPAVAVGISILGISSWSAIWIYLVANFAGGAAAALVFNATNVGQDD